MAVLQNPRLHRPGPPIETRPPGWCRHDDDVFDASEMARNDV